MFTLVQITACINAGLALRNNDRGLLPTRNFQSLSVIYIEEDANEQRVLEWHGCRDDELRRALRHTLLARLTNEAFR